MQTSAVTSVLDAELVPSAITEAARGAPPVRSALPAVIKVLDAGEMLFAEGDDADCAFEVTSGLLRVYRLLPDGRRQITGLLPAGQVIGIPPDGVRDCTVEAATPATLRRYRRAVFERRLDGEPGFARRLLAAALLGLHQAQDQALLLGRKSAMERLASFLIQMSAMQGGGDALTLPIRRGDIADYLGLTIETVSRSFTKLKVSGVIALHTASSVEILDRDRLEGWAEGAVH